jgi:hypothetical protein
MSISVNKIKWQHGKPDDARCQFRCYTVIHSDGNGESHSFSFSTERFGPRNAKRLAHALAERLKAGTITTVKDFEQTSKLLADQLGIMFRHKWRSYEDARKFVDGLKLKSISEWREYCQGNRHDLPTKPDDIPTNPFFVYNSSWIGWTQWLGKSKRKQERKRNVKWMRYEKAKVFARSLGLRSADEWRCYARGEFSDMPSIPMEMPLDPDGFYAGQGWSGWRDFLGPKWRSFASAKKFVRGLNLETYKEWIAYVNGDPQYTSLPTFPADIPIRPDHTYILKWRNWGDWLGHG